MNEAVRAHIAADPEFPEDQRRDNVTYLYGECPPETPRETGAGLFCHGGCLPPLEVQSTPLCEKHARLYSDWEHRATTIKDVPAALFDGGRILEMYTANTTITIYGDDPELVQRAAEALRRAAPTNIPAGVQPLYALIPANEPVPRTLPPPDREVLAQTEPCR